MNKKVATLLFAIGTAELDRLDCMDRCGI